MKISQMEASSLTICKLSIGIKRKLLLGEQIGLGALLGLTDLCRFFRAEMTVFNVSKFLSKITESRRRSLLQWLSPHPDYLISSLSVPQISDQDV